MKKANSHSKRIQMMMTLKILRVNAERDESLEVAKVLNLSLCQYFILQFQKSTFITV